MPHGWAMWADTPNPPFLSYLAKNTWPNVLANPVEMRGVCVHCKQIPILWSPLGYGRPGNDNMPLVSL